MDSTVSDLNGAAPATTAARCEGISICPAAGGKKREKESNDGQVSVDQAENGNLSFQSFRYLQNPPAASMQFSSCACIFPVFSGRRSDISSADAAA
jgi:hypothetical protein